MKMTDPLDELYNEVLRNLWLSVELNNNDYRGVLYIPNIPKDEREFDFLYRLQNKDQVLKIRNPNNKPSDFASLRATQKTGALVLDIVPDKFKDLCKKYNIFVEPTKTNQVSKKGSRELRREINEIIKNGGFTKKQKILLKILAKNFKPKNIRELKCEIPCKDASHLVLRARRELKGTKFTIENKDRNGIRDGSSYQLVFTPSRPEG